MFHFQQFKNLHRVSISSGMSSYIKRKLSYWYYTDLLFVTYLRVYRDCSFHNRAQEQVAS